MSPPSGDRTDMGLFGRIAIQEGFITAKQFEVAEVKQRLMRAEGVQKRIGAILVDEGTLTHEQVRRVLDLQKKSVMKCPGCGALFNIENRAPGDRFRCKRCRSILQVPSPDENVDQVEEAAPEKVDELADRSARKDTASRLLGREMGGCRVEKLLGKGNMGAVYLGRQVSLDRPVALKVLRQEVLNNPEHVARFEQEARSAARLAHPNIVQVFNMGRDPSGQYFIIMEYVDGQSLGELVKGGGRLEEREALEWILGAAEGLAEAHREGIVHRDVKPDNILVDHLGRPKVSDFGLVRSLDQSVGLTQAGSTLGTPSYMAPEQALGSKVDGRADLYSLGTTLFRLLAGATPFQADTPLAMMMKHAKEPVPSVREIAPEVSRETDRLVARLMAKDPADRFATGDEVAAAIGDVLAGRKRSARRSDAPVDRKGPAKKKAQKGAAHRRPRETRGRSGNQVYVLAGAAAGVAALLVVLVGLLAAGGHDPAETPKPHDGEPQEREQSRNPGETEAAEPEPPPPDPLEELLAETEAAVKAKVDESRFREAIALWNGLWDRARKEKLRLREEEVQERILEVKTAWRRAAHGRMDGILESVRESIEAGAYGEALDAAKSFPEGWLVVEGIEDKHEDLKYLVQRATYLKGKAAGGSSRTPRRPRRGGELALDKTYAVLRDKARVQAAWKPNGEVRYEEKEKELILTVKDDLRRATLFSNYEKQNAWLDYVVEFEYRTNAGLRFLCRVNRRRNRQTIVTLPDASAWRAVRIDVSGVLLKATVGGKTWDDVVVDLDPGYCGFEVNRKGTASIRNLRLRITKKE